MDSTANPGGSIVSVKWDYMAELSIAASQRDEAIARADRIADRAVMLESLVARQEAQLAQIAELAETLAIEPVLRTEEATMLAIEIAAIGKRLARLARGEEASE